MPDNRGTGSRRAVAAIAAFAAAYGTRRILTFGWKQLTGREPPSDPDDPRVGLGEALGWAIVIGAGIETARLLAMRATTRKLRATRAGDSR